MNEVWTMPFEGEKHFATLIEFPYRPDLWREKAIPAGLAFAEVAKAIAAFEPVIIIVYQAALKVNQSIIEELGAHNNISIISLSYNDSWGRDTLPIFLKDGSNKISAIDFGFNSWGGLYNGLYKDWSLDNAVGHRLISDYLKMPYKARKDFILEGGSIHTNGHKTLLTTKQCLLSPGRNPALTQAQIEQILKDELGQEKVIWLPYGVYKDETSGHVDNIACFLDETHVLLGFTDNKDDPQYELSLADLAVLNEETTADGKKIEVIKMPFPAQPLYATDQETQGIELSDDAMPRQLHRRLATSYVNFYMGENFIIMPSFGLAEDAKAKTILEDFYQGKKTIVQVPGREILLGGGNIHCITKQIPFGQIEEVKFSTNKN